MKANYIYIQRMVTTLSRFLLIFTLFWLLDHHLKRYRTYLCTDNFIGTNCTLLLTDFSPFLVDWDFSRKIGENSGFRKKKFWTSEFLFILFYLFIYLFFCVCWRVMTIQTHHVSFSSIIFIMHIFSKWWLLVYKNECWVATTPSTPNFDGLPYPHLRWYSHFFNQNERKEGC